MTRPLAKALAVATLLLGFTTMTPRIARSEVVIQMTGTVVEGNLNGVDLAGANFSYGGIVTNNTNIDDVFPGIGTFVVDTAFLDFGDRGFFDIGLQPSYFSWILQGETFSTFIGLSVNVETSEYQDGFSYRDVDANLPNFDASQLSNFGPYGGFDEGFVYGATDDPPLIARNDFGDLLTLNALSGSATLTITAIPEPSAVLFGSVVVAALCVRYRRRSASLIGA